MKTFLKTAAQGEALFRRIDAAPDSLVDVAPVDGQVIIAHSETGHHHVMSADTVTLHRPAEGVAVPEGLEILYAIVREPTALEHLRPHDTHEPILFEPGVYEIRRQREYTPEGFRRVED